MGRPAVGDRYERDGLIRDVIRVEGQGTHYSVHWQRPGLNRIFVKWGPYWEDWVSKAKKIVKAPSWSGYFETVMYSLAVCGLCSIQTDSQTGEENVVDLERQFSADLHKKGWREIVYGDTVLLACKECVEKHLEDGTAKER